ncbi:MAG: flagellar assembly protein FliW, partial [Bryobacteraceae bacterium]
MPQVATLHFGAVDYEDRNVIEFPLGLPGFDDESRFLMLEREETAPVIFLQSLRTTDLAFLTLPAAMVYPDYELAATPEDIEALGLPAAPELGRDFLCLAILTLTDSGPAAANLKAPIVVNLHTRQAWQIISMQPHHSA